LWNATPFQLRRVWGGVTPLFHQMLHGVDIQRRRRVFPKASAISMCWTNLRTKKARTILRRSADQGGPRRLRRATLLPPVRRASVLVADLAAVG